MNTPALAPAEPARFWRRAIARAIDGFVTAFLATLLTALVGALAFIMTGGLFMNNPGPFYTMAGLLLVPVLTVVAWLEVSPLCRLGQTLGMSLVGIKVIRFEDPDARTGDSKLCDLRQSILRWAIPHGAGLSVGVVATLVAVPRIKDYGGYVGVGAGVAVWAMVYASSLFDKNGRGWHDKAAGTIVVAVDEPEQLESGDDPGRSPPPAGQDTTKREP